MPVRNLLSRGCLWSLLGLVLLTSRPASAQKGYPAGELFGGYSLYSLAGEDVLKRQSAHGFGASVAGNFHKSIGFVADFSGNYGRMDETLSVLGLAARANLDYSIHTVLFGPRFSYRTDKATAFFHALVGMAHARTGTGSVTVLGRTAAIPAMTDTALGWGFGGGVDASVNKRIAVRVLQVDWTPTGTAFERSFRLQSGLVVKFGG